jgi:hypothetical protein
MSDIGNYTQLEAEVRKEFPRFSQRPRDKSWLAPIFWLLSKVTGTDYDGFHTTVFSTMYTGPRWERMSSKQRWKLLMHEKEHIAQFHCFPLGRWAWPVNHLLMALCYILILPFFFTFRAKFERAGYMASIRAEYDLYGPFDSKKMEDWARWLAGTFGGSAYAWMWTRSRAYAWAMKSMQQVNEEGEEKERVTA